MNGHEHGARALEPHPKCRGELSQFLGNCAPEGTLKNACNGPKGTLPEAALDPIEKLRCLHLSLDYNFVNLEEEKTWMKTKDEEDNAYVLYLGF